MKDAMRDILGIQHHFPTDDNQVYIRQMSAKAGYYIETHQHNYTHYSILAKGTVQLEVDGVKQIINAPQVITIEAGITHKITAITDFDWFCVHHANFDDESQIDDVLIKKG